MKRRKKNIQNNTTLFLFFFSTTISNSRPCCWVCVCLSEGRVSLATREKRRSTLLVFFFMPSRGKTNGWARNFHLLNSRRRATRENSLSATSIRWGKEKQWAASGMEAGTGIRAGVFWVNFKSIFKQNSRPRFTPNCVIAICKLDAIKKYISNHHLYKAG